DRAVVGGNEGLRLYDTKDGAELYRLSGHAGSVQAVSPSPDGHYLLSAGGDGTLRLWDLKRLPTRKGSTVTPVVALYAGNHEHVVWTPQGSYAASPSGEAFLGRRVNNGPERLAAYYRIDQFPTSYYRPEMLRGMFQPREGPPPLAAVSPLGFAAWS